MKIKKARIHELPRFGFAVVPNGYMKSFKEVGVLVDTNTRKLSIVIAKVIEEDYEDAITSIAKGMLTARYEIYMLNLIFTEKVMLEDE